MGSTRARSLRRQRPAGDSIDSGPLTVLDFPPEITIEIFQRFVPAYPARPELLGDGSPLILTRICRLWRDIAHDTPGLWRAIEVRFPAAAREQSVHSMYIPPPKTIQDWLARSHPLPISVGLRCADTGGLPLWLVERTLAPLLDEMERWEYTELVLPSRLLPCHLAPGKVHHMPVLVGLRLESVARAREERAILSTIDAPGIQRLHMRLGIRGSYTNLLSTRSFGQLSRLKLVEVRPDQVREILECTPQVVECYFCFSAAAGGRLAAAQPNDSRKPVVFPRMSTLALDADTIRFDLIHFLGGLALPALKNVAISRSLLMAQPHYHPINTHGAGSSFDTFAATIRRSCTSAGGEALESFTLFNCGPSGIGDGRPSFRYECQRVFREVATIELLDGDYEGPP
ncbi:F-box domain-containing protein [Mycena chlorophos]|uniref:F-box domain-containing protein n=1 Tax=Mycena chlorophos TaxID=658473 RepID=A0A8H6SCD3_MYCCL|nr:F-box domain-containing protein [Mycena chlorophos]